MEEITSDKILYPDFPIVTSSKFSGEILEPLDFFEGHLNKFSTHDSRTRASIINTLIFTVDGSNDFPIKFENLSASELTYLVLCITDTLKTYNNPLIGIVSLPSSITLNLNKITRRMYGYTFNPNSLMYSKNLRQSQKDNIELFGVIGVIRSKDGFQLEFACSKQPCIFSTVTNSREGRDDSSGTLNPTIILPDVSFKENAIEAFISIRLDIENESINFANKMIQPLVAFTPN